MLAIREDREDLAIDDLEAICRFVRKKLLPMFDDTMYGSGGFQWTRQRVLEFIPGTIWSSSEARRLQMMTRTIAITNQVSQLEAYTSFQIASLPSVLTSHNSNVKSA